MHMNQKNILYSNKTIRDYLNPWKDHGDKGHLIHENILNHQILKITKYNSSYN